MESKKDHIRVYLVTPEELLQGKMKEVFFSIPDAEK